MSDAQTASSALSAAITFKVQKKVLENLRAKLVWADELMAEKGEFSPGLDTLTFIFVPDLSVATTPLTEGTRPDKRALSISTVTVDTDQYGDLVSITDIAKVKSPIEIVSIASERLSRSAQETIDQITRDVIAAGGTPSYQDGDTTRAGLASTDLLTAADLNALATKMYKAKIPRFGDGFYHLYVHPDVAYDLRSETTAPGGWMDTYKYTDNTPLLKGEVGRLQGFRVMEVQNAPTFSSTTTVYGSIACGDIKPWGAGELQTLQTYHVAPGGDHTDPLGQEELVGWKVNFGVAILSNARYFRMESAATAV